jgi:hypothetical protein
MPKYPALRHEKAILLPSRARLARIQPNRAEKRDFGAMLEYT